jgi:hypothetical protein
MNEENEMLEFLEQDKQLIPGITDQTLMKIVNSMALSNLKLPKGTIFHHVFAFNDSECFKALRIQREDIFWKMVAFNDSECFKALRIGRKDIFAKGVTFYDSKYILEL